MTEDKQEPLFFRIQKMSMAEKLRLASVGDREARAILIRDTVKQIQLAVINNPRIKESEIIAICKSRHVFEDVLRAITRNRDWMKLYPVKLSLIQNPKTPLTIAMKLVPTILRQDLKALAKSKSVSQVIAQAARRRLLKTG